MTRCIHLPFIVLLVVWRNQSILGSDVDLFVTDATCVGNNVTLKCTIDPFTTVPSATWSRNGSNALTTCTSGGPCTEDDLTFDGIKYTFSGGSAGIQVAFQIQLVENGIEWICSHNATPYRYTFEVNTCQEDDGGGLSDATKGGIAAGSVGGGGLIAGGVVCIILMITGSGITVYVKKGHDITFGKSLDTDVLWEKDGKTIEATTVQGTRCKIVNASEEHDGLYVCTSGKYKQKYCLVVLDDIVYTDGRLDTGFVLDPDQNFTTDVVWKKDGSVVNSTHYSGTKLIITKPSAKDEGLYVCTLKSIKKKFKYYVIVIETEEIVYAYQDFQAEFGKTIPDEETTVNARWTKKGQTVESHHSERTKFVIEKTCGEDEGLYVCTFGPNNMTLNYYLIVVGTEESLSVKEGGFIKFGKDISKFAPTNVMWRRDDEKFESDKITGTKIEINKAEKNDEGLYVLTIGPNNMQFQYKLTVLKTDEVNETVKKLKKKKTKKENGEAEAGEDVTPATVENLDETQKRLLPKDRLPPVENPGYIGSSPLDRKTYGTPLPLISQIPAD